MPQELIDDKSFNEAVDLYRSRTAKKEPYQPLSELLTKIKNIWTSNSIPSAELSS